MQGILAPFAVSLNGTSLYTRAVLGPRHRRDVLAHKITPLQYRIWPRDVSSSRTRLQLGKEGPTLNRKLCRSSLGQQLSPSPVNVPPFS